MSDDLEQRCRSWLSVALLVGALSWAGPASAVQFSNVQVLQGGIDFIAALAIGPEDPDPASLGDGCIYAVSGDAGTVHRVCFDITKTVASNTIVVELNGGLGTQFLLGVAMDPASDPNGTIIMYLPWTPPSAEPFDTRIARAVSVNGGASYSVDETFIRGLGASTVHTTNGLAIGPDGCLYLAKGNNSNAGFDPNFAETRLSGAILRACFRNPDGSVNPGFDRDCGDGSIQEACDVEVYASGFRNPYDLVWHSNGRLYATDNDMDPEDNPGCGAVANTFGCACFEPQIDPMADELNLVEVGRYYGSPNPYLANPAELQCQGGSLAGFSCTISADCLGGGSCLDLSGLCVDASCGDDIQCLYFGSGDTPTVGEDPNGLYRAPIAQPSGARMNGIAEYGTGVPVAPGGFCSDWNGQLVTAGSTTNTFAPRRLELSPDGTNATDQGTAGFAGLEALDIVVGADGVIYSARWPSGGIQYIAPTLQTDPDLPDFFDFCPGPESCDARCVAIENAEPVPALRAPGYIALVILLLCGSSIALGWRHNERDRLQLHR